jgi:hypothetical protein
MSFTQPWLFCDGMTTVGKRWTPTSHLIRGRINLMGSDSPPLRDWEILQCPWERHWYVSYQGDSENQGPLQRSKEPFLKQGEEIRVSQESPEQSLITWAPTPGTRWNLRCKEKLSFPKVKLGTGFELSTPVSCPLSIRFKVPWGLPYNLQFRTYSTPISTSSGQQTDRKYFILTSFF